MQDAPQGSLARVFKDGSWLEISVGGTASDDAAVALLDRLKPILGAIIDSPRRPAANVLWETPEQGNS